MHRGENEVRHAETRCPGCNRRAGSIDRCVLAAHLRANSSMWACDVVSPRPSLASSSSRSSGSSANACRSERGNVESRLHWHCSTAAAAFQPSNSLLCVQLPPAAVHTCKVLQVVHGAEPPRQGNPLICWLQVMGGSAQQQGITLGRMQRMGFCHVHADRRCDETARG